MMAPPVISTSTFVMVVRMLAVLCSNSPAIAVQLLRQSKCALQSNVVNATLADSIEICVTGVKIY